MALFPSSLRKPSSLHRSSLHRFSLQRSAVILLASAGSLAASAQTPLAVSHVPAIVQSGQATLVAPIDRSQTLHLAISLPLRNPEQLEATLADLYNPASPNFHQWLSQPEFEARFGPEPAKFTTLLQWAQTSGMTVTYQSSNGRIIEVDAPVEAIDRAFNVVMTTYHDSVLNRDFHAPDREPTTSLPFQLLSVDNLENSAPIHNQLKKGPASRLPVGVAPASPSAPGVLQPDGTILQPEGVLLPDGTVKGPIFKPSVFGSGPTGAYLPSDMRMAYYGTGNLTGAGQIVGIFSFDGYLAADPGIYYANTGMTTTVPLVNVLTGGFSGGCVLYNPCEDDEQILDIVQVQGMAPGLTQIRFYEGTNASTELNQMVSDNLAKVISSSWGGGNFGTASDTYFTQMAMQGQTYLNATGDDGAFNRSTYGAPSLDANITQVGGTELTTNGAGGAWSSEVAWGDSGGGYWITGIATSGKVLIPSWQSQAGVVTATNKASSTYRNVPDMAAEANFDNPTVSNGAFIIGYGGTSFATPRMAGYLALANQQAIENGLTTLGAVNSKLYSAGLSASTASIYHDITSGTNPASAGAATVYTSVAGYDLVTGWGSPNGPGLINYLAGSPVPDFALAPTAVSIQKAGGSVTTPISLTTYNAFSGTVTVTASGLPTGVTAITTPGTPGPSNPPTITLTADSTSTMATYNVTLTGTSGALSHTATLPVTVMKRANDDFTITATSATVPLNETGTSTLTITAGATLVGPISLAVSGVPVGVTASLSSAATPGSDGGTTSTITLSLSAAGSATPNSYSVTVTATSSGSIVHTVAVPFTVTIPPSLIVNGGFETGAASPWVFTTQSGSQAVTLLTTASGIPPHNGNEFVLLDGGSAAGVDVITQQVAITPGYTKATLGLWFWVLTAETGTTAVDTMTFQLTNTSGTVLTTLGTVSNLTQNGYWAYLSYDVSAYIGQTVVVQIVGKQAGATGTDFLVDDVSLVVQ